MKLIVGLGNPGKKYENTRHNLGFMVIDALARKFSIFPGLAFGSPRAGNFQFSKDTKSNSEVLKVKFDGEELILAKPQTFVNASGYAVRRLVDFYLKDNKKNNITIQQYNNLYVIHDDLDLLLGRMKSRQGGAAGGHHGVESIIEQLGTDQFVRFRLGIDKTTRKLGSDGRHLRSAEKYVLSEFASDEKSVARRMIKKAVLAIEVALQSGLEEAMNRFNP